MLADDLRDGKERQCQNGIDKDILQGILDGELLLPDEVAEEHRGAVACKAAPGAGHIADAGHKDNVYGNHHRSSDAAHNCSPPGLVGQLVPEGEVEVNAHENLRHHHDGNHFQALPVGASHKILENGQVEHHSQECQQGEDDEVLHACGKHLGRVLVAAAGKDERLVGIAEGLREQAHDEGNLRAGAINAQLHHPFLSGHEVGVENLVANLVEDADESQQKQGPGVAQHALRQRFVEAEGESFQLRYEAKSYYRGAEEIDEEDKSYAVVEPLVDILEDRKRAEHARHHQKDEEIEQDAQDDERHLECHKFHRPVLLAQTGKHDCLEGIQSSNDGKAADVLGMFGIAHSL